MMNTDRLGSTVGSKRETAESAATVITYTTRQLGRISGISRDQLAAWDDEGLLRAARGSRGRISQHTYTREQALGVIALGQLKGGGVRPVQLRRAAQLLPSIISQYVYLVFDGKMLYGRTTQEEVMELLSGAQGMHVLRVRELIRRLTA